MFKVCSLAILVVLGVVAGGCGGAKEQADTLPVRTSSPAVTATTAPTEESSETTATPTPVVVQDEDLQAALLRLEDMPAGWSVSPPDEDDEDSGFCGEPPLKEVIPADHVAEIGFQQSEFGPFLLQVIASYHGRDAQELMDLIRKTANSCTHWDETDESGNSYTWRLSPLSFPKLGDEAFAMRLTVSDIPFFGTMQVDAVYVRRGNGVMAVAYSAVGPAVAAGGFPLEDFAQSADDRWRQAPWMRR